MAITVLSVIIFILSLFWVARDKKAIFTYLVTDIFIPVSFYDNIIGIPTLPFLLLLHLFRQRELLTKVKLIIFLIPYSYILFSNYIYFGQFSYGLLSNLVLIVFFFGNRISIDILDNRRFIRFLFVANLLLMMLQIVFNIGININHLSQTFLIVSYLYFSFDRKVYTRNVLIVGLLVVTGGSRTASVVWLLMTVFWYRHYKLHLNFVYAVLFSIMLFFSFFIVRSGIIRDGMGINVEEITLKDFVDNDAFTSGRSKLNEGLLLMFLDNVWFGHGHGSFKSLDNPYNPYNAQAGRNEALSSHNANFALLAENGVFGSLLFLGLLFHVLKGTRSLRLRGAIMGYIMFAFTNNIGIDSREVLTLFLFAI